jgi:hypothetical protein
MTLTTLITLTAGLDALVVAGVVALLARAIRFEHAAARAQVVRLALDRAERLAA